MTNSNSSVAINEVTGRLEPQGAVDGWKLAILQLNSGERYVAQIIVPAVVGFEDIATFPASANDWQDLAKLLSNWPGNDFFEGIGVAQFFYERGWTTTRARSQIAERDVTEHQEPAHAQATADARDVLTKEMRDIECRSIVAAAGGDIAAIAILAERGFAVSATGSGDDNLRTVSHQFEPRLALAAREMAEDFHPIADADVPPPQFTRGAYESATARYAAAIAPGTSIVLDSCIKP